MGTIIIIIVAIIAIIIAFFVGRKVAIHPDIVSNEKELQIKKELELQINTEKEKVNSLRIEQGKLKNKYQETQQYIRDAEKNAEAIYNSKMKELNLQYGQKEKSLSEKLKKKEDIANKKIQLEQEDFNRRIEKAEEDFSKRKEELTQEIGKTKEELNSLKATKIAAIEAARKEKMIHENQDAYCLRIPIEEQNDISILKSVRNRITKPRAVNMVIWSNYFQPLAKKMFPKILGAEKVCGIYKITNQETGECYVGQAKDVRKRWADHCKMMLQIDAPQGNKLYAAAEEYGLENFSFELLEECPEEKLNEKERYFISLYSADSLGYNSQKGNR